MRGIGCPVVLAVVIAGCGGDEPVSEDAEAVLRETFANEVSSGVADLEGELTVTGDIDDSATLAVTGPFELGRDGPRFDLRVAWEGGSLVSSFRTGLVTDEDAAYLELTGRSYEVDEEVFARLPSPFGRGGASIRLDILEWFREATVAGIEQIDGTETIHVAGPADLGAMSADLRELLARLELPSFGPIGPVGRTEGSLDVFTGAEDRLLRRLELTAELEGESDGQPLTTTTTISISLDEVNEDQEIEAPADAPPIASLSPEEVPNELAGAVDFLDGERRPGGHGRRTPADKDRPMPPLPAPRPAAPEGARAAAPPSPQSDQAP